MNQKKTPDQLYTIAIQRDLQIILDSGTHIFDSLEPRHLCTRGRDIKIKPPGECPKCRRKLHKSEAYIPIGNNKSARIPGLRCPKCNRLYVYVANDALTLLKDNPFAKSFNLDGKNYYTNPDNLLKRKDTRYSRHSASHENSTPLFEIRKLRDKRRASLRGVADAVMMICVEWDTSADAAEKNEEQYIILSRKHPELSSERILLYSEALARELLTAATYKQRQKRGEFNGRTYCVTDVILAPKASKSDCIGKPETLMPTTLYIRSDGGFASSIKNRNQEIVDLLLYAPRTHRYEIIRATYNRLEGICYSDIWLYRAFAREYGRPDSKLEYIQSDGRFLGGDWDELKQESVLRMWGYNVAEKNGLSASQRRERLMNVVDLEAMSVSSIIHLLMFLIDTHTADKYINARYKWQDDLNFIKGYKANPERFYIANDVRRW